MKWNKKTLDALTAEMYKRYEAGGCALAKRRNLPQRETVLAILADILEVLFPGYSGKVTYNESCAYFTTGDLLDSIHCRLVEQINHSVKSLEKSEKITQALLKKLPVLRDLLELDCQAFLDGDPATKSKDEIIMAYPGFKAICIHRVAHELYAAKVPLIPRIMSEYAHTETGIDINPGATIGKSLFIDHGTGVVIGETAIIGDNVRIYQGVTLGALFFPKDEQGRLIKGTKRHPNIGNNVTIYAGATILGNVFIGDDSVIGGNVWLTDSIPAGSRVIFSPDASSMKIHKKK